MGTNVKKTDVSETRRRVLALFGGASVAAGGLALLSGCNDEIRDATSIPTPTPTATASATAAPGAYTATSADWLNFTLQVHYLLAAYLQRSLDGTVLSASLTSGSGAAGQVKGGQAVAFSDPTLKTLAREVAGATVARVGLLRRTLGSAVTAQPAIDISGGQGSAFQAIAAYNGASATANAFNPYASDKDFLLGAVALFAVATSAITRVAALAGSDVRASLGVLSAGVAANDSTMRNALFYRADLEPLKAAAGETSLFDRANAMSAGRDQFDGPSALDRGIGNFSGKTDVNSNITIKDANWIQIRRTPEQALGVLYASASSVPSGGFFPAGINGTIHVSGANIA
ncbi:ferritin-like domain-containing protein [Sphingomonas sp. M6A6_1c]